MKSLIQAVAVAVALAAPVAVFAQSNQPLTRAEVHAQLVQVEQAGYHPGDGDQNAYPAQIQAADAKIAAQNGGTDVGGVANGSSGMGQAGAQKANSN